MLGTMSPIWPKAAQVFHEQAEEYDGWFEESLVFDIELAALAELTTKLVPPRLEVGVGPGRFAEKLGVTIGIDPAFGALSLARKRLDLVCQGVGEQLPVRSQAVATAFLLLTLCFTERPQRVLTELRRIINPGGHLVLGMVPRSSPWGKSLWQKKKQGHAFYRHSTLYDIEQVVDWLEELGFAVVETRSTLFQKPDAVERLEPSRSGLVEGAGFTLLVAQKG